MSTQKNRTRLVIAKGKTVKPTDSDEWNKTYYEVEVLLEDADARARDEARAEIEQQVNAWLKEPNIASIPALDLGEIDALPWKTFQTKEPAKPKEHAWLLWKRIGGVAHDLHAAIKRTEEKKLTLGLCEYSLSGTDDAFINRHPLKEEKAK